MIIVLKYVTDYKNICWESFLLYLRKIEVNYTLGYVNLAEYVSLMWAL